MADNNNEEQERSAEVQEVLTKIPRWIIRWGNAIIMICVFGILLFSNFVPYPDKVDCEFIITTQNKPFIAKSSIAGEIKNLFVQEGEEVSKGQIILTIKSEARHDDISHLNSVLDSFDIDNDNIILGMPPLRLGILSDKYHSFEKAYVDYYQSKTIQEMKISSNINSINYNIDCRYKKKLVYRLKDQLQNDLHTWQEAHIYRADESGTIYFPYNYEFENEVDKETLLFSIHPNVEDSLVTMIKFHVSQSSKINNQQKVLLHIPEMASLEREMTIGHIKTINTIPDISNNLTALVNLDSEIDIDIRTKLFRNLEITGKGIILTNDKSLLSTLLGRITSKQS